MKAWAAPLVIALTAFFLGACDDAGTVTSSHEFNARTSGTLPADAPRFIVIENTRGSLTIEGSSNHSVIGWFLDAWATAGSQAEADRILAGITMDLYRSGDTLIAAVKYPTDVAEYRASVSLTVPNNVPCIVRKVNGSTSISYLKAGLSAVNPGTTTINAHEGNCELAGATGDVTAEVALPDSGSCRIALGTGNIALKIPRTTSAQIAAATGRGGIVCSGLSLSDTVRTALSFTGKSGSGHGSIQLSTGSGSITITGS